MEWKLSDDRPIWLQLSQQLFLCLNFLVLYNVQDLSLTGIFHGTNPPNF